MRTITRNTNAYTSLLMMENYQLKTYHFQYLEVQLKTGAKHENKDTNSHIP